MKRWICILLLAGCSATTEEDPYADRCAVPQDVDAAPTTIKGALDFIDALPRPVTVACVVEALERPFVVTASSSPFSAQPAAGEVAPRIFIVRETLVISVVPDGDGSHVIEFSEERPNARSVKAELAMPVEGTLDPAAAFDHLLMNTGSVCGSCHKNEQPAWDIEYAQAFESQALKPTRNDLVTLEGIVAQANACDANATPSRCEIYDALLYRGGVMDGDFGRPLPTIFD